MRSAIETIIDQISGDGISDHVLRHIASDAISRVEGEAYHLQADLISALWPARPRESISEYAARVRHLPLGSPWPGPWSNDRTPYLVEIMDAMGPFSGVQRIVVCKGAQTGLTTAAENVILYYVGLVPAEIMFCSANERLLKKWVSKRLDPALRSAGLYQLLGPASASSGEYGGTVDARGRIGKGRQQTGDAATSKEFPGGAIDMVSARSAGNLRSMSKRVLIRDEIDGAPEELYSGEGNWLDVSYARTKAWGRRRRILDISTPATLEKSVIWREYERGDRRRFFVPCPLCGEFQALEWAWSDSDPGLKFEAIGGSITEVFYDCAHCRGHIREEHRSDQLRRGEWRPTAEPMEAGLRSYHLSSLYAPPGMVSWADICAEYLRLRDKPDGLRAFQTLTLGLPYVERGEKPIDVRSRLIDLRGNYPSGEVPRGILYLTAAIDVQRGRVDRDKGQPARVEIEILGHGSAYRTASIMHRVFIGPVDDPFTGAWEHLHEWAIETGLEFARADGFRLPVSAVLIDSGDGVTQDAVYRFCRRWANTSPSRGFKTLRAGRPEGLDEYRSTNVRRWRSKKIADDQSLVEINTTYYKSRLYQSLGIRRGVGGENPSGFADHPRDYPDSYFDQLTAEERRADGSFYKPKGRQNEALDLRVMNLCAGDTWLDAEVTAVRAAATEAGASRADLHRINYAYVCDLLQAAIDAAAKKNKGS